MRGNAHCQLRNHKIKDTVRGTGREMQELFEELDKATTQGIPDTRFAVTDESGDV